MKTSGTTELFPRKLGYAVATFGLACLVSVGAPSLGLAEEDDGGHEGHAGDIYIGIKDGRLFTSLIGSHDDHDHDDDHGDDDHDDDHGDDDHDDDDHDDDHGDGDGDHDDDHGDGDHDHDDDHGDGDGDHDDDHSDGDGDHDDDHGDDDHGDGDHDDDHGDDDHDDDHDGDGMYAEVRVFAAEMGESGIPGFTSDPGWEAFPGTFSVDTRIGWNAPHGLMRWTSENGLEDELSATLTMNYNNGPTFSVGDLAVDGFDLACASDGSFHLHTNFILSDPSASDFAAAPGIYVLELELYSVFAELGNSEPFWIVFNHGGLESDHDAAIEWIEENMAGEECPGDFDGNHVLDVEDLLNLLSEYGSDCSAGCLSDLNNDQVVGIDDLLGLLEGWGSCH